MDPFNFDIKLPKITPISHWMSGEASFIALRKAVNELARTAPDDHDVVVEAFGLSVGEIRYAEPHTLLFSGIDSQGNKSFVVCHFSQLLARVVYLPKRGPQRVITGFAQA